MIEAIGQAFWLIKLRAEFELRDLRQHTREAIREARAIVDDARETKRLLRARADLYENEAKRQRERADGNEATWKAWMASYETAFAQRNELQKKIDALEAEKREHEQDETVRSRPSPLHRR